MERHRVLSDKKGLENAVERVKYDKLSLESRTFQEETKELQRLNRNQANALDKEKDELIRYQNSIKKVEGTKVQREEVLKSNQVRRQQQIQQKEAEIKEIYSSRLEKIKDYKQQFEQKRLEVTQTET